MWAELHDEPILQAGDRQAIRSRIAQAERPGYSVDLSVDPAGGDDPGPPADARHDAPLPRPRDRAADEDPGARGQAQLLLNDLNEYHAWLEHQAGTRLDPQVAADRWLREVYRPTLARIAGAVGPGRDLVEAYCDVLEQKWYLSEVAGRDIGLDRAIEAYVLGAPAPETSTEKLPTCRSLSISSGWETRRRSRKGRVARSRSAVWLMSGPTSHGTIRAMNAAQAVDGDAVIRVEGLRGVWRGGRRRRDQLRCP